jgi:hypothetical protein
VGPRAGLDAEVRGKILRLCRGSNPGRPVRSQTLYRLSYRLFTKYYYGGRIKDAETHGHVAEIYAKLCFENLMGRDHF